MYGLTMLPTCRRYSFFVDCNFCKRKKFYDIVIYLTGRGGSYVQQLVVQFVGLIILKMTQMRRCTTLRLYLIKFDAIDVLSSLFGLTRCLWFFFCVCKTSVFAVNDPKCCSDNCRVRRTEKS